MTQETHIITTEIEVLTSITCDVCKKVYTKEDGEKEVMLMQFADSELFGTGGIDVCMHCLWRFLKPFYKQK